MTAGRRGSGGFTLVELMVVVVILGILSAGATVMLRGDPVPDAARQVRATLQGARRMAIQLGPVRDTVVAATGISARVQVECTTSAGRNVLSVYRLVETSDTAADWVLDSRVPLPGDALVYGVSEDAVTDAGGSPPTALGEGTAETLFFPTGQASPQTWWLTHRRKTNSNDQYRVFVLPLSGLTELQYGW